MTEILPSKSKFGTVQKKMCHVISRNTFHFLVYSKILEVGEESLLSYKYIR